MKKFFGVVSAIALVIPAHAAIWDDFSDGNSSFSIQSGFGGSLTPASVPGGDRFVLGQVVANPNNQFFDNSVNGGMFTSSSGFGTVAGTFISYGVATFTPPNIVTYADMNVNAAAMGDRFRLNFVGNDLPLQIRINVYNSLETGIGFQTGNQFINVAASPSPFSVDVLFSAFSGSVDFSSLDEVFFLFNTDLGPNHDFALDSIEVVPEPATLAALGIGAAAILRRRRK